MKFAREGHYEQQFSRRTIAFQNLMIYLTVMRCITKAMEKFSNKSNLEFAKKQLAEKKSATKG